MAAFVKHHFKKGFILDEERIRKINEILRQRLAQLSSDLAPTYRVRRADAFSYTTSSVEDIIREDNSDWQRITNLSISVADGDDMLLQLIFDEEIGTQLNIEGQDRDFTYLFFSDLKQYLLNDVNVVWAQPRRFSMNVAMTVMTLGMVVGVTSIMFGDLSSSVSEARRITLESQDLHEKLNFIIQRRGLHFLEQPYLGSAVMLVGMVLAMAMMWAGGPILKTFAYFCPSNEFIVGRQIERYVGRKSLRSKILWGVIIASIVSIATGLLVWWVTIR